MELMVYLFLSSKYVIDRPTRPHLAFSILWARGVYVLLQYIIPLLETWLGWVLNTIDPQPTLIITFFINFNIYYYVATLTTSYDWNEFLLDNLGSSRGLFIYLVVDHIDLLLLFIFRD